MRTLIIATALAVLTVPALANPRTAADTPANAISPASTNPAKDLEASQTNGDVVDSKGQRNTDSKFIETQRLHALGQDTDRRSAMNDNMDDK